MKNLTDQEILDLYNSDLSELYKIDKEGIKNWDEEKLQQYWHHFSKFIKQTNAIINNLIIPIFNNHTLISYTNEVTFNNCTFIDDFHFKNTNIKNFSFTSCKFEGNISFKSIEINNINIKYSLFGKTLSFDNCSIYSLLIEFCKIFEHLHIKDSKILEFLKFNSISIADNLSFENSSLSVQKKAFFSYITGINKKAINFEKYYSVEKLIDSFHSKQRKDSQDIFTNLFIELNKSKLINFAIEQNNKQKLKTNLNSLIKNIDNYFKYVNYQNNPNINFKELMIENNIIFTRLNLYNFRFEYTNLEYLNFIDCNWKIKNRLILLEEEYNRMLIENQYRQLKKVFANNQDWEMSGLAYISEMEMRKKRLGYKIDEHKKYFSKDALEYLVYLAYGLIGGYAQNFIRPLTIFLLSTFLIFPLLYMLIEPVHEGIYNLPMSFKKSIANAMPIIKFDPKKYQYWFLKAFQTFFSTILLAFVILGLRKRFKQ